MRIAIFTDSFWPKVDGISISISNMTTMLSRKHAFKIFAPRYKRKTEIKKPNKNIAIERIPSLSLITYDDVKIALPSISKIMRMVREFEPDIIHVHTPGPLGVVGLYCARKQNIPSIGTFHTLVSQQLMYVSLIQLLKLDKLVRKYENMVYKRRKKQIKDLLKINQRYTKTVLKEGFAKRLVWKLTQRIYDRCDIITVPSPSIKKELIKHGFKKPVKVISNGIDLIKFKPKKGYKTRNVKLLHVGRIGYEKNIEVIIKSLVSVKKRVPNIRLSIVGDGPALNSLKLFAHKLGLNDNITFHGHVPNKELNTIYASHDIFLTASTMETQGLVILEAMACGLPVIGVKKYAISDLVMHGKNGFIVKPFDAKGMAEYIEELVLNGRLRERFGKASRDIAKTHDLKYTLPLLRNIYNSLI